MSTDTYLYSLVQYGINHQLIEECDRTYIVNHLLDALSLHEYKSAEAEDLPLEDILKVSWTMPFAAVCVKTALQAGICWIPA